MDNICPGNYNFSDIQKIVYKIEPSSNQDFCNFSIPLNDYYELFIGLYGTNTPLYTITPQMMTTLVSASSTSPASYRTIPSGATAEYVAHKEIILQPGFTAEYGSDFTARIEPCAACEERMVQMDILDSGDTMEIDTTGMNMRMFKSGDTTYLIQPSPLTLFPNPTQNTLTVQSPDAQSDIQIFDHAGRAVYRWYIESRTDNETILNISDIPAGTYILRVVTKDGKTHIGRFVKN